MNGKSWRTSLGGVGMILSGLALGITMVTGQAPFAIETVTLAFASISGGIGLLMGKDAKVTGAGDGATTVK